MSGLFTLMSMNATYSGIIILLAMRTSITHTNTPVILQEKEKEKRMLKTSPFFNFQILNKFSFSNTIFI